MSFDIYGDRAVEAMALIREFARVEYWDYFKGDPERALEAFCVMQDAAEAKSAARIADLEAQVSALKAAGGVPPGYTLVSIADLQAINVAMQHMGDQLNNIDAVEREDEVICTPGFVAINYAMRAAPQIAEQIKQPIEVEIVPDWPACNPVCDYEDPWGMAHDHRNRHCDCEAAKASKARQRASMAATQPSKKEE